MLHFHFYRMRLCASMSNCCITFVSDGSLYRHEGIFTFHPFSYLLQKDWFAAYSGCTEVIPIGYFQDIAAFCHRQMGLDFRFYCKFVPNPVHERNAYLVFSRNTKIINSAQFIEMLKIKTSMYKIFYGLYHRGATPKTARICNRKAKQKSENLRIVRETMK